MAHDLDRIRFVTRHFGDLQFGLRYFVPMGLIFLLGGLVTYFDSAILLLLELVVGGGAVFMMFRSKPYFQARFGEVEQPLAPVSVEVKTILSLGLALIIVIVLLGSSIYGLSDPTVRLQYLCYGSMFLVRWISLEHRLAQGYHLVFGALLLGLATSGAFPALVLPAWVLSHHGIAQILAGSAMVLAGLLDHRQLVRTLKPLEALAEGSEAIAAEAPR
jgi:hypothetical protein